MGGPIAGQAHAAAAAPAGDVISIGDPHALGQIDLYLDPICPFSGKLIRSDGEELGRRIDNGALRVNVRFVNFLEKYSASGTYDRRAIYAAFVAAGESKSSVTLGVVRRGVSAQQATRSAQGPRATYPTSADRVGYGGLVVPAVSPDRRTGVSPGAGAGRRIQVDGCRRHS
nr:hypothetical protein [Mycolicibacterium sp.]